MSAPYPTATSPNRGPLGSLIFIAVVVGVVLATLAATLLGNPALAVAPVAGVAFLLVAMRLPLRITAGGLIVLLIGVDDNFDKEGQWRTPLSPIGDMMQGRLDQVLGIPGLAIVGMEAALILLFAAYIRRRVAGSTLDTQGQVLIPPAVRDVMIIYLGAVFLSQFVAMSKGLPTAPWKLRNLLHPVVLSLLFLVAFRPRDIRLVGKILVVCAIMRALLVIVAQRIAIAETGGRFESGTGHGDSILFATMIMVLLLAVLEFPTKRNLIRGAIILPLFLLAAVENERRLVWVMIGISLLVVFILVPMKGWKVTATKVLLVILPALIIYISAGWNAADSGVFAPVQTIRSVVDTSVDHSAYWREVEDWNIATTMRESPLLGKGLSGQYSEQMFNDDISAMYKEYKEWPHNSVLGLLMLMGLVGFTGIWLLLPTSVFMAVRTYKVSQDPEQRIAALGCVSAATACLVQSYGDLGAHFTQWKVFAALAIAISTRLAVHSGAFPARREASS